MSRIAVGYSPEGVHVTYSNAPRFDLPSSCVWMVPSSRYWTGDLSSSLWLVRSLVDSAAIQPLEVKQSLLGIIDRALDREDVRAE